VKISVAETPIISNAMRVRSKVNVGWLGDHPSYFGTLRLNKHDMSDGVWTVSMISNPGCCDVDSGEKTEFNVWRVD
jgi:hypothetical protein